MIDAKYLNDLLSRAAIIDFLSYSRIITGNYY